MNRQDAKVAKEQKSSESIGKWYEAPALVGIAAQDFLGFAVGIENEIPNGHVGQLPLGTEDIFLHLFWVDGDQVGPGALTGGARHVDQQQHRLELLGGGSVDFWTLESPDAGRGRKYALAIIDEAAMARHLEEAWTAAIRPTLADYQGRAWFLSTPKGGNYFKTLFDRAGADPDWARWQLPTMANPYIRPEEIAAMEAELPRLVYQQEVLAEFIDLQGAALRREWLRYRPAPSGARVVLGVDLALSTKQDADYTAIVALSRDGQGLIDVRDAQRIRAPFHQVLQFVQQLAAKWNPTVIAIESVQYQAAVVQELLRTTRLPVRGVRPDKDKLTRFLPLAARYEQGLVYHDPGLPGWFADELLSFPVGDHDDAVDALGYAWQALGLAAGGPVGMQVACL